ncbi:MAG: arylsulfatase [Acidobacteria bacterium]|nr:arylsulfatase [Acidobacteriota bacterium]
MFRVKFQPAIWCPRAPPCDDRPMTRRELLGAFTLAPFALAQRAANRPNIIVILADDLGFGDLACYNADSKIPTPHLDRLAREGTRFIDAHTPCGVCSPTRYGLLTGRYPWRTELKRQVLWPWDKPLIEKDRLTLPGMLKSVGYSTAAFGKWHLGWEWTTTDGSRVNDRVRIGDPQREIRYEHARKIIFTEPARQGPTSYGFDYHFGVDLPNFPPYTFFENGRLLEQPTEQKPDTMFGWPGAMAPGWRLEGVLPEITRRAANHIRERGRSNQPFFVYFPMTGPHTPVAPDDPFRGRSRAGVYGDFVYQCDWSVGQILEAVRDSGAAENTIILFTSDNGPENLTYPLINQFNHASQGPLRGAKRMLWEGGHRVPFIAWGPGRVPAGRVENEVICLTDIMATVASVVGYKLPENSGEDSYDISAAIFGRPRPAPIREATVHHSINDEYGLRQGDWVYIESARSEHGQAEPDWWRKRHGIEPHGQPAELFHLKEDLRQTKNLYAQYPDRVREMRALLEKYKTQDRSVPVRR